MERQDFISSIDMRDRLRRNYEERQSGRPEEESVPPPPPSAPAAGQEELLALQAECGKLRAELEKLRNMPGQPVLSAAGFPFRAVWIIVAAIFVAAILICGTLIALFC